MLNSISFCIFYFLIYLIGRGLFISFSKFFKIKINEHTFIKTSHLFPLFGLFAIGEIKLILNFITSSNIYLIFLIAFAFYYNLFFRFKSSENFIAQIVIAIFLGFSSNSIKFSFDAGLYHLNSQYWLNESKLVLGLVNLHSRYGYSSFIEYINAPLWTLNNFLFQHFTNLTFIVVFFFFMYKCIFNEKFILFRISAISILIFGFLDNFGLSGGRNGFLDIEPISKHDTPFAVVFSLLLIYTTYILLTKEVQNEKYLFLIIFLFLFSVQLRIFALTLTPLILYILFKNKMHIRATLLFFHAFIGFAWILKNVLISSCFFYPIEFTCINKTRWYNANNAFLETNDLRNFHNAWNFQNQNIFEWFVKWSEYEINYRVWINFLISLIIILLLQMISTKKNNFSQIWLVVIPIYLFFSWSVSSPSIRMGLSIFIYIIFLTGLYREELNIFIDKKIILYLLLLGSIALMPRVENYKLIFSDPFKLSSLQPPIIEYYEREEPYWGLGSSLGSVCWVKLDCVPENIQIKEDSFLGFRVFQKINK